LNEAALHPTGALVGADDIRAQTRQVFDNLRAAHEAVGAGFEQVVKLNLYLVDATHLPVIREVRDQYVNTRRPPASTAVEVRGLFREDALIEVEAVGEVTMREAVPEPAVANVLDYVAAWNEPDAATRLKLLQRCWADDGAYVDPNVELRGRSALCEHISKVQAGRPGARLEMMSGVELHHHVVRFLWRLVRADGRAGETSIDVGEVDADGRLTKIVGFFGEPPKR
jgi:enamine deaminase RidA (YjgF/YER057c/UK114 family)